MNIMAMLGIGNLIKDMTKSGNAINGSNLMSSASNLFSKKKNIISSKK